MLKILNDKIRSHKTTEVVSEVLDMGEPGVVCILLDTGASATIILRNTIGSWMDRYSKQRRRDDIPWVVVSWKRDFGFNFPKTRKFKIIRWVCHEDTTTLRKNAQYYMIIGADLLTETGIKINFNSQWIVCKGIKILWQKHIMSKVQMLQLSTTKVLYIPYLK